MNNIEKLAIEHGAVKFNEYETLGSSGSEPVFIFEPSELEAFAKALQSSEPVAVQTKQIYEVAINGSWMESNLADYVKHRGIKRTLFTHPPASVSLEKYNKLLDALINCVMSLKGYRNELNDNQPCDAEVKGEQAIAEAEGKEG